MNPRISHIAVLAGMVGGPALAHQTIERLTQETVTDPIAPQKMRLPHPIKGAGYKGNADPKDVEVLESWGITYDLSKPLERGLFFEATVPAGWVIKPTDHYMYSNLCDANGLVRAQIMYKATDHDSWISLRRRFSAGARQDSYVEHGSPHFPAITDEGGKIYWRGAFRPQQADRHGPNGTYTKVLAIAHPKIEGVNNFQLKPGDYAKVTTERLRLLKEAGSTPEEAEAINTQLMGMGYEEQTNWLELHGPEKLRDPSKLCSAEAHAVLAAAYPDYADVTKYWDVLEPVFPPSLSAKPEGLDYSVSFELHNLGGGYSDCGTNGPYIATTKEAGIEKCRKALEYWKGRYDVKNIHVRWEGGSERLPDIVQAPKRGAAFRGKDGIFYSDEDEDGYPCIRRNDRY